MFLEFSVINHNLPNEINQSPTLENHWFNKLVKVSRLSSLLTLCVFHSYRCVEALQPLFALSGFFVA